MLRNREKYYSKDFAPMKFHKLVWYVWLPLKALTLLGTPFSGAVSIEAKNLFIVSDYIARLVIFAVTVFAFVNCFKWNANAWRGIIGVFSIEIIYDIIVIFMAGATGSFYRMTYFFPLAMRVIMFIPIFLYYQRRKPIFIPE